MSKTEEENNKLTDPRGEDKKEKQHIKLRMNKQDVYISGLIHKRFSKRIHSLLRIVKL